MTEINTMSACVDAVLARAQRPGRSNDVVAYVRQTLRECQIVEGAAFSRDMTEDSITATASPHIWERPNLLRFLRTVKYNIATANNNEIYPDFLRPGKILQGKTYYYYGGPTYYAMAGVSSGITIDLAYYSYFAKLPYYATVADRPATFSLETDSWSYHADYDVDDATRLTARNRVTNWMLTDWFDLIVEGGLAKILKSVGDERAASTFGLYKSLQKDLLRGEPFESLQM